MKGRETSRQQRGVNGSEVKEITGWGGGREVRSIQDIMRSLVTIVESRGDAVCLCVDELINSRGVQVLQGGSFLNCFTPIKAQNTRLLYMLLHKGGATVKTLTVLNL